MKVVCCKKCGAKYKLEDDDDISTYECTSCTGDLELCEGSTSDNNNTISNTSNSNISYCVNCGLKYALRPSDNILDYECESCGGALRYVDEYLNEDIDKIVAERENQKMRAKIESKNQPPKSGRQTKSTPKNATNSKKSLSRRFGNFFSENRLHEIADEEAREKKEKNKEVENKKTAKTSIPKATHNKFEKEFSVPKTNDYNVLRGYLINEFYKGVCKYYGVSEPENIPNGDLRNYFGMDAQEKIKANSKLEFKDSIKAENETIKNPKNIAIIIGLIIFIISIIEIIFINTGIGIFTIFVGVILLCYGLYRQKDEVEVKKRTKIIRDQLLSLPEEYYVFYDVRVPGAKQGINHLVIGPSGIYEIISKKYNPKSGASMENNNLIEEIDEDEKIEEIISPNNIRTFRYTIKQSKFPQDNKIKQTSLKLGENLINFLNENEIRNCFVEPLVGFVNDNVVVINMPLTDEDLFIDELIHKIKYGSVKLDSETIDKAAVLLSKFAADCMNES